MRAVLQFSSELGHKRAESAAMIRSLLERIPMDAHADYSGMRTLVSNLGLLGEPNDLELLTRYCEHDDASMVVTAIYAVARIKPELALEKARGRIRNYLEGMGRNVSFGWYVMPYFDLIFWQEDKSAIEILERALEKKLKDEPDRTDWVAEARLLLDYLRAAGVEERTECAIRYAGRGYFGESWLRGQGAERWLQDVGKRLVREGADPNRCQPLLNPPADRPLEYQGSSREAEPW
jgi:hypothetical protein